MDLKKPELGQKEYFKGFQGFRLRISKWLGQRLIIRQYSYSYRSILAAFIIFLALVAVVYYSGARFLKVYRDPNVVTQREIDSIVSRIGKFMDLPEGEKPTLATVSDRDKLKDQPFFAKAKNGDKVLIYQKARKAILYRPSRGKVIEVANLASGGQSENPAMVPAANSQKFQKDIAP